LLLLGPLVLGEKLRRSDLLFGVVVAFGMTLFFAGVQAPQSTAPNPALGNLTAGFSGFTWAMTVTTLRFLGRSGDADVVPATVVLGNIVAFLGTIGLSLPMSFPSGKDLAVVLYLGIVQIAIAYIFFARAIRAVPAFEVATVLLLEPVFNPIWTWWIHDESPGSLALLGGAVILGATLVHTWKTRKKA
jgi:drug/metabolite transporter (DMT)-like permease